MRSFNFLLFLTFCSHICLADTDHLLKDFNKIITESYNFTSGEPTISVNNKYGNIIITSHDQNHADVRVEIVVEASSQSRAEQIFDKIEIHMKHTNDKLSLETEIKPSSGWSWTKKKEQYSINYHIALPKKSFLSVENKYGNISCTDHDNMVDINLKYGNGKIQNVNGKFHAKLGYVNSFSTNVISGEAHIDLSYSHIIIESAQDINIDSKYSNFTIASAAKIQSKSQYDKYELGTIHSLQNVGKYDAFKIAEAADINIETKYTNIQIGTITHNGIFNLSYGDLNISNIDPSAITISLNTTYTGCKLGMSGAYNLDIDTKYVDVDYPRTLQITHKEKDANQLFLQGFMTHRDATLITARMKYGHLKL